MNYRASRGAAAITVMLSVLIMASGEARALSLTFVDPGGNNTTPGHPSKAWTDAEKNVVNEALSEWVKFEVKSTATWTVRWEDADLFKDWPDVGTQGQPGFDACDLTNLLGTTVSGWGGCDQVANGIPIADFPINEIYFNATQPWFIDPTPAFDGDDSGEVPGDKFDFLTAAKHEL